jgi:biotin transport system substrate-specific component
MKAVANYFLNVKYLQIILSVCFLTICAQITIPTNIIPISLITLGLTVVSFYSSKEVGLYSVISYVLLGALGAPVFSNFSSYEKILSPSGGFILGYILAAYSIYFFRSNFNLNNVFKLFIAIFISSIFLYASGFIWLSFYVGYKKAFIIGIYPFVIPGIIKSIASSFIIKYLKK